MDIIKQFQVGDRVRFNSAAIEGDISDEKVAQLEQEYASDPDCGGLYEELEYVKLLRSKEVYTVLATRTVYTVVETKEGSSKEVDRHDILLDGVWVSNFFDDHFPANYFELVK